MRLRGRPAAAASFVNWAAGSPTFAAAPFIFSPAPGRRLLSPPGRQRCTPLRSLTPFSSLPKMAAALSALSPGLAALPMRTVNPYRCTPRNSPPSGAARHGDCPAPWDLSSPVHVWFSAPVCIRPILLRTLILPLSGQITLLIPSQHAFVRSHIGLRQNWKFDPEPTCALALASPSP